MDEAILRASAQSQWYILQNTAYAASIIPSALEESMGKRLKPYNPVARKQMSFVEDLVENLPIGLMILDQDGRVLRMNRRQEETSNIARDRILGKTFHEAFPLTLKQGLKKHYFRMLKKGAPFNFVIDRYTPQYNPEQMTYRARGARFSSGRYFILINELEKELYREKRLVEERTDELQVSEKFLTSMIDSSPNIVISTDLENRVLIFNRTAERIFGYKEREVLKHEVAPLFKSPALLAHTNRRGLRAEVICVRKDGSVFPASMLVSEVENATGRKIARMILLSDLSEQKALEERLYLTEKLALYSELMGGIAHQLNNPLIGVVNFSEMLLSRMDDEDSRKEMARTIHRAGKECLKIITSVLNCFKDPHLTFTNTDVHEVLRDAIATLKAQFGERLDPVRIEADFDPGVPPISGDAVQLKQSFLNILTNAVQAMMPAGGRLRVATALKKNRKEVKVIFSDSGCGIPREFLNKVFLPFFTVGNHPGRHGLGLSFAYQIIKNHDGHLKVDSKHGVGTTFTAALPLIGAPREHRQFR
jgi:two-component system, NtrC family, sensor kinase